MTKNTLSFDDSSNGTSNSFLSDEKWGSEDSDSVRSTFGNEYCETSNDHDGKTRNGNCCFNVSFLLPPQMRHLFGGGRDKRIVVEIP